MSALDSRKHCLTWHGNGASPGVATGVVRVIRSEQDLENVEERPCVKPAACVLRSRLLLES